MNKAFYRVTSVLMTAGSIVFLTGCGMYMLWLLLRSFVADYFKIPSSSMEPTLHPGDEVVVNKLIMGARIYSDFHFSPEGIDLKCWRTKGIRPLRVNDIVVFNYPLHDGRMSFVINHVYCKRIAALPGDSLSIEGGVYHNNNYPGTIGIMSKQQFLKQLPASALSSDALPTMPHHQAFNWTIYDMGPLYIPRKGDVIRIGKDEQILYGKILEWEKASGQWHQFKHNYYFMAGDNVTDSHDSRYWGLVPEEYVIGVVTHALHPHPSHVFSLRSIQ